MLKCWKHSISDNETTKLGKTTLFFIVLELRESAIRAKNLKKKKKARNVNIKKGRAEFNILSWLDYVHRKAKRNKYIFESIIK